VRQGPHLAALEERLGWAVAVGMRFSDPGAEAGLAKLRTRGVSSVAAIVLSPQYSPMLMGGYARALEEARAALGDRAPDVRVAGAWHLEPGFVAAVGRRIGQALDRLARLPGSDRSAVAVLLTAHSLPRRVADQEPGYLDQLRESAEAIAAAAELGEGDWQFCWQSAGHEPGEWMKPDFADLMPLLAAEGKRAVLVAPVQFLADHLEILYDIDVGAREQAERFGLDFARIDSLNVEPGFVDALASVARSTLGVSAAVG